MIFFLIFFVRSHKNAALLLVDKKKDLHLIVDKSVGNCFAALHSVRYIVSDYILLGQVYKTHWL